MIERCEDYRRVNKFLNWRMLVSHDVFYMMKVIDGVDSGVLTFHPWRDGLLMHANLGDNCKGKHAKQFAIDCFNWVFENKLCDTIYAAVPKENKKAQRAAVFSGMEYVETGENERFYKIDSSTERKF